jgi:integrase
MASLIKRGAKWYGIFQDHTGEQKWRSLFTDYQESKAAVQELEAEARKVRLGLTDPQAESRRVERSRPATSHVADYEVFLRAKGCNKWHVSYTIGDLKAFLDFAGVDNANKIHRNHVAAWVDHLKTTDPDHNAPRTINRRVGAVQAWLRHLKETGGVTDYVLFKFPKQKVKGTDRRKRRALTAQECRKLIKAAPIDRRNAYRFALLTGFRFSEICSMTPASFNLAAMTVTVKASDAKNKARDQTIPLHAGLAPLVRKLAAGKGREERLFVMPRREDAARLLREDCVAAKVDKTHVDFHALRHTYITRLAEAGIHPKVLQTLARHSTLETTLEYYVHFRRDDERAALALLADLLPANHAATSARRQRTARPK